MTTQPSTRPSDAKVPLSRGIIHHSLQRAVREKWGDAGMREAIARLPSEVAKDTTGPDFLPMRWYPTSHIVAWYRAILEGPAKLDDREFAECITRTLDISMGLVRRTFMRLLTPAVLAEGAGKEWGYFHTAGKVDVETKPGFARMTISEHPFVDCPVSRNAIAIMSRHMVSRARARNVRETHQLEAGRLVIVVTWAV